MVKVFTIDEANSTLPVLQNVFSSIYEMNSALTSINKDLKMLYDIWGKDVENKDNIDNYLHSKLVNDRIVIINQIKNIAKYVYSIGCVVKDLNNGLVDFYYDKNGELVFLCWKYGEEKITCWHSITTGASDRRPIREIASV